MTSGIAYATLSPAELARRWNALQRDPSAPDFCELDAKAGAYLGAGTREVVLVELSGRIRFFAPEGERAASALGLSLALPDGTCPRV
jgi:hypothetical protein